LEIIEIENLAMQICRGLEAARKKGIAHRDLKPQNILIDKRGHASIADFGLARSMGQSGLSVSGIILGTPAYISPEQWRGDRGDFRSDIYSLGILLYEMATARPLFKAESELGYLMKHLSETPAFGLEDKERVPDYLRRIILRCLEKEPEARYHSAAEVEADLMAHRATNMPLRRRLSRLVHKAVRPALLLLILTVLLGGGYLVIKYSSPKQIRIHHRIAVLPFINKTQEERYAYWSNALADILTTDLGQSRYLHLISQDQIKSLGPLPGNALNETESVREHLKNLHQRTGAEYIVMGEFSQEKGCFRIYMHILDLKNDEYIDNTTVEGVGEESFFSLIDHLTDRTKQALKLSHEVVLQDFDKDVRLVTTRSLDALKAYSTGKELYHEGKFSEAIEYYASAIKLDSDFAMAYAGTAYAMGEVALPKRKEFFEEALKRSNRLSYRERLLIEGRYHNSINKNFEKARLCFTAILKDYPIDLDAWEALASALRNMEYWHDASQAYRELDRLTPGRIIVYSNLFDIELEQGHFSTADELLATYQNDFQRIRRYHRFRYHLFFNQRLYKKAEQELKYAEDENDNPQRIAFLRANLFLFQNKVNLAYEHVNMLFSHEDTQQSRIFTVSNLNNLSAHLGRYQEIINRIESLKKEQVSENVRDFLVELELQKQNYFLICNNHISQIETQKNLTNPVFFNYKTKELDRRLKKLYLCGRMLLEMKQLQKLPELLRESKILVQQLGSSKARFHLHLEALGKYSEGSHEDAWHLAEQALLLFPYPDCPEGLAGDFLQTMAKIQIARGRLDEAIAIYQKVIKQNIGRLENAAAWVMAHVELARLLVRKGESTEARSLARRVVDWWEGGDLAPEIVAEMRRLVTGD